jgi:hypothetical protein
MSITIRDLAETISGLRKLAARLRLAAGSERVPLTDRGEAVLVSPTGLERGAEYLDEVCEELLLLVPETPIEPIEEDE